MKKRTEKKAKATQRKEKLSKFGRSAAGLTIQASDLMTTTTLSTRDYVYRCLDRISPGNGATDETILNNIPVDVAAMARCLNREIPLIGDNKWASGGPHGIQGGWTVDTLITRTDYRRTHV